MARAVNSPPSQGVQDDWFDGRWWEINPTSDLGEADPEVARRRLYQAGRNRGSTPRTRVQNGKVYIQRK